MRNLRDITIAAVIGAILAAGTVAVIAHVVSFIRI